MRKWLRILLRLRIMCKYKFYICTERLDTKLLGPLFDLFDKLNLSVRVIIIFVNQISIMTTADSF